MKSRAILRYHLSALTVLSAIIAGSAVGANALEIRMGFEPSYPPFVITMPDGSTSGMEADLAKELCKRLQADCKITVMDFAGLLPALVTGRIDMIPEDLLQTKERSEKAELTREVVFNPNVLVVSKDWKGGFDNEALRGKRIGVYKGGGQNVMLTEGVKVAVPVGYDTLEQMALDLEGGRIDAILDGRLVLSEKFLKGDGAGKWKLSDRTFFLPGLDDKGSVWAVRKGETGLRDSVNKTLDAMVKDCTYTKIRKKYTTVQMLRDEPAECQ